MLFGIISSFNILKTPLEAFPPMILYSLLANMFFKEAAFLSKTFSKLSISTLSFDLLFLFLIVLENNDLPITTP